MHVDRTESGSHATVGKTGETGKVRSFSFFSSGRSLKSLGYDPIGDSAQGKKNSAKPVESQAVRM